MPEISLTVFIVAIAAALAVGFLLAYLVQNGKIASLKIAESKAREELFLQFSEKEKALAIKETEYFNVKTALEAANLQNSELAEKNQQLVAELQKTAAHAASVEASNKHIEEWIAKADTSLKDSFASISKNIAENNNRVFLETANDKVGGIVMPVSKELKELRDKVEELESKRARAYGELNERVDDLKKQNSELKNATDLLNNTLKNNAQRGKWGEEQLRRIAELAGMVEHIDFEEQSVNAEGSRPD
ncbi:MAG: DNA recombination protein RmuC, partial [Oscillospiraceae bacterium]|nr:DNA recombination protein RmuC [Oscillospiraceae bacterium]